MPGSNIEEFTREVKAISEAVTQDWLVRAAKLGTAAYERLVLATEDSDSVDTGAYRAEHAIDQGGRFLYEHPDRVGPDAELESQKKLGLPPLIDAAPLSSVQIALESTLHPGDFGFLNQRFYSQDLEYGGGRILEPRLIYQRAADATGAIAEVIAKEPSEIEVLRRNAT